MTSSPGCWHTYGKLLAREYSSPPLFAAAHRLSVDAYALQHPGNANERRARQSVWLHYCSLLLIFEHGATHAQATGALQQLASHDFPKRPNAPRTFDITVPEVVDVSDDGYAQAVTCWARCAFDAWQALKESARMAIGHIA